jgi:hypothetical protein
LWRELSRIDWKLLREIYGDWRKSLEFKVELKKVQRITNELSRISRELMRL